ncbi:MAG TPA: transaldolase family protein [Nocardioides sp.]|jgi:transaldolase|nr:transaldolase family protein [Nocardioides sp.]
MNDTAVNGTDILRRAGQRLWLDTISRRLLDSGTLRHYIEAYGLTGVTSNPTILSREMAEDAHELGPARHSEAADDDPEKAVVAEAVQDVQRAADLLRRQWEATRGIDGWVSIEVPPTLAYLGAATVHEGRRLHAQVDRPNVFIKVPATWPGVAAIEALTVAGIPTNATLVFDTRQHHAVENCYLRGLERRLRMGLALSVPSVASVFVSRWDAATNPVLPREDRNLVGLRMAHAIDRQHRDSLATPRWSRLQAEGATPQRLVWASTAPKDPELEPTHYAQRLPLPETINTMPESVLLALAQAPDLEIPGRGPSLGHPTRETMAEYGVDEAKVAQDLQHTGVQGFAADWDRLLAGTRSGVGSP